MREGCYPRSRGLMQERKCAHCEAEFQPVKGNQKYCTPICYNKVAAERRRTKPREVTCAHDGCCTFQATNTSTRYCPEHDCARKVRTEYHRSRDTVPDLFDQPLEFKTLPFKRLPDGFTVLIAGDLHIPFQDTPTLECVERFWNDLKPNLEILGGDLADFYAISPFDTNPSRAFSLQDELDTVRGWLEKRANKNPNAKRVFLEGNHEDRLRRWLWRHGSDMSSLRALTVEELLGLKELNYQHLTYRSVVDLLGCRIEHGYRASRSAAMPQNVAQLMARATNSSGICHHTHRVNAVHWTDSRGSHSYRENGCLCRMDLEYAPFPNWQHAVTWGVVHKNKLHLQTATIHPEGMRCEGVFYPRIP